MCCASQATSPSGSAWRIATRARITCGVTTIVVLTASACTPARAGTSPNASSAGAIPLAALVVIDTSPSRPAPVSRYLGARAAASVAPAPACTSAASSSQRPVSSRPPTPQSVEWLLARPNTSKPIARRSSAVSGCARVAQSSGRADGVAAVSVRSTMLVSRFPNAASALLSSVTTSANARSPDASESSGRVTMQSPTALTENEPSSVVPSAPSTRVTAASYWRRRREVRGGPLAAEAVSVTDQHRRSHRDTPQPIHLRIEHPSAPVRDAVSRVARVSGAMDRHASATRPFREHLREP